MEKEEKDLEQDENSEEIIEDVKNIEDDSDSSQQDLEEDEEKEIEEDKERYLRLQADFANYKKRVEKEKASIYTFANEKIVTDLLDVIDNFERAFTSVDEAIEDDSFYKGVIMVYKQLMDILEKNGLEEIKAKEEKFDPNLHHAVMQEENDEYEENTIIDVFQKGYKLKDKVIRPSMVKVSN
ncbi:nucleotide exchange factor GrpE [Clostridium sp. D2Q-14]|uniref:nucleotide exchange factor GrpE n=1 Tax=Anaeromonas gelatinilytica TaxID=2683194 RepID=UPI00193BA287|nr:nucleotide exchange factor GrpE [Anaeromonas gelatinilytica]MBS4535563.1 nucleotide exchange factor GrpE [Anaeromonas gelatinilytica]